jgi:hypothetical protein
MASSPHKPSAPPPEQPLPESSDPSAPEGAGKKKQVASRKPLVLVPDAQASAPTNKALTLHTNRAAASVGEVPQLQAGQITEWTRSGETLGSLTRYAEEWNSYDMCKVTSGLSKERELTVDPKDPQSVPQQLLRLKKSMRETDLAWFNVDKNVTVSIKLIWNTKFCI